MWPQQDECVESSGPWPFITRKVYRESDQSARVWSSRHHRKRLELAGSATRASDAVSSRHDVRQATLTARIQRTLWRPGDLNWWIGTIFASGALLFIVACTLSLAPSLAGLVGFDPRLINALFFAGSIPFTTAAYLQLFQAANAGDFLDHQRKSGSRPRWFGWQPSNVGWLSSLLQFAGTILFNVNTFDAMLPSLNWFQQELLIWVPNIIGSTLFLSSGYLAMIEVCHAYWSWDTRSISWWVVFTNLLGCVGFMISAVLAIVVPWPEETKIITLSVILTLVGAIGFFIGAILMISEPMVEPGD